jgi:hypothetical protein
MSAGRKGNNVDIPFRGGGMKKAANEIPAYTYGSTVVSPSAVSLEALEKLKVAVGFSAEDEHFLRMAGDVLADQTKRIVEHWRRGAISSHIRGRCDVRHASAFNLRAPFQYSSCDPMLFFSHEPNCRLAHRGRIQMWIDPLIVEPIVDRCGLAFEQENSCGTP